MLKEYRNKIFNEDVLEVLKRLPDNSIDMIWSEPDYNVNINYSGKRYTKKWDDYIAWYCELIDQSMRVLKKDGNLFTMNYGKQNAHLRVNLLDVVGYEAFEYIWCFNTNVGMSPKHLTTAHRSILHVIKGKNRFYKDAIAVPYKNLNDKRIKERIANGHLGRTPYSYFYFDLVKNVSKDKTLHSCQIPKPLIEMFIKATTKENDDIFILFGGSGGEIITCREMKRNFISCELHPLYFEMINDRLKNDGKINDKYKRDK